MENQVIAYLRDLAGRGVEIHLLNFERERVPRERQRETREALEASGIAWHWRRYDQRPSLPATLYDVAVGTIAALALCLRHAVRLVHARSRCHGPAASVASGLSLPLRPPRLLAEEYAGAGHWRPTELKFRLTKAMERIFFRQADAIVVLAQAAKADLLDREPNLRRRSADITVIPCCVGPVAFAVTCGARDAHRRELGGRPRPGLRRKARPWYQAEEMARFFAVLRTLEPQARPPAPHDQRPRPDREAAPRAGNP